MWVRLSLLAHVGFKVKMSQLLSELTLLTPQVGGLLAFYRYIQRLMLILDSGPYPISLRSLHEPFG